MKRSATRWITTFATALLFLTASGITRADVVSPPPGGTCPEGSRGNAHHGMDPASCTPVTCTGDEECSGGMMCRERRFCTAGGWVTALCGDGEECEGSYPCTTLRVCVPEGSDDGGGGGSCRIAGPRSAAPGGIFVGLVALAVACWRLKRSRSG